MPKSPLRFKDLLKALKPYGVKVKQGGKGSETILVRPLSEDSMKGPQYTIKKHGTNPEISWRVIEALLQSLGIPRKTLFGVTDHLRPIVPERDVNSVFVHKVAKTKCKQPTHGYTMGGSV